MVTIVAWKPLLAVCRCYGNVNRKDVPQSVIMSDVNETRGNRIHLDILYGEMHTFL